MLRLLKRAYSVGYVGNFRNFTTSTFSIASNHRAAIAQIVGEEQVLHTKDDMDSYTHDWTRNYSGGSLVCFPQNTAEVSSLMKYCNTHKIGVVPQGGNTGLVGGGVGTSRGELILSLRRMNKIIELDQAGVLTCESGCILENLSNAVAKEGFVVPLDLAAKGGEMS